MFLYDNEDGGGNAILAMAMIAMAAMMVTVVARVQVTVTCQLLGHYREPDLVLANVDLGPLLAGDTPSTTTPCCYDPSTGVWTV
jgi:hypothetical protein